MSPEPQWVMDEKVDCEQAGSIPQIAVHKLLFLMID
jgi:hypothetical protein